MTMTPEQRKARDDLAKEFGVSILVAASELAKLKSSLEMMRDAKGQTDRDFYYHKTGEALEKMFKVLFVGRPENIEKIAKCAARIDTVIDQWVLDELENLGGLPSTDAIDKLFRR